MRKKELLSIIMNYAIPQQGLAKMKSLISNDLIILAYHRVKDIENPEQYSFDDELISASTDQFEHQMYYIRKYYNPISESQLLDAIERNIKLPKRSVLVTFDDGFDDNYLYAFPILKKYSIPAVIFLATDFIGSNEPIWFDWLAALVFSSKAKIIKVNKLDVEYVRGNKLQNRKILTDLIVRIRKEENSSRLEIIEQLKNDYSNQLSVDYSESRGLTWDQITEMNDSGITFGSHTVTHPILSRLNNEELVIELTKSKKIIEEKLDIIVNSIAYPTGMADSISDGVVYHAQHIGYKIGYSYIHGNNRISSFNVFSMKRLHIESHISNAFFNSMLNFPEIFKD